MKDKHIINFDFQGWPVEKLTLREILLGLGGVFNSETNKIEFDNSRESLDSFPVILTDDGMGYGVDEQFVSDCSISNELPVLFREKKLKDVDIWVGLKTFPGDNIKIGNKEYVIYDITTNNKGEISFNAYEFDIDKFLNRSTEYVVLDYDIVKKALEEKRNSLIN